MSANRQSIHVARAPLIEAEGTRFDIGFQHGRQASELAHGTLAWSFSELAAAGLRRDEALAGAMRLLEVVRLSTPEMVEEVAGIAAGAGMSLAEVAVINTRYELLFLGPSGDAAVNAPRGECTLFGIEGSRCAGGDPIIGQNVDLGPESRPFWVMLCVRPAGAPRLLTVTLAGMLAQEGINSAGLALCGSMIRCAGWRAGYPSRKFLRRRVLEQRSVAQAIDLIRSSPPRASSHNLMLADAQGDLVDVETTINDAMLVRPVAGLLAHSNHYLSPRAQNENACIGDYLHNSAARHERMRRLLEAIEEPFTPLLAASLLRDHAGAGRAICRHGDRDEVGAETNVAVIAEPAKRRLHVALGPPCEAAFTTYQLHDSGVAIDQCPDVAASNKGEAHAAV
jgi:isopenicillin-N N-acyltransferase like protein